MEKNNKNSTVGEKNKIIKPYLNTTFCMSNGYSMIPVVGTLTRRTSCCVGRYGLAAIRSKSFR